MKKCEGSQVLADISECCPGLMRAQKLQTRAAQVGFDWPTIHLVLDKLKEEVIEFEECFLKDNGSAQEELGDILFVCANLARHLQLDAEEIMRRANKKFEIRFHGVEQQVKASGKDWADCSLSELEHFWQHVKRSEKL